MTETDKIIEILGGAKFLGKDSKQKQSLIPAIKRGFSFDALGSVRNLGRFHTTDYCGFQSHMGAAQS